MSALEGSSKMDNHFPHLEAETIDLEDEFFSFLMKAKENFSKLSLESDKDQEHDDESDLQFMKFISQMKQDLPVHLKEESEEPVSMKCSSPSQKQRTHSVATCEDKENEKCHPIERSKSVSNDASFNIYDVETKPSVDFLKKRNTYAYKLFHYFNRKVFNSRLPGDTPVVWSDLLLRTAGKAHCRRNARVYSCKIELSTKVLTSLDRLRDTLLHEMCHAAVWIVNKSRCCHGPLWQTWAARCKLILPQIDLPQRCHYYEIACRFTYKCSKCHYKIGRHSKSIKIEKVVCPYCYSKLVLIKA